MSDTNTDKVVIVDPQFCVATSPYELMLLLALFPNECKFVGLSIEHGRYFQALFTYHHLADAVLKNWYKMTECDHEEESLLKTFFYYLAQCSLYGDLRKFFESHTRSSNHYGYRKDYIFKDSIVASSYEAIRIASDKETKIKVETDEA